MNITQRSRLGLGVGVTSYAPLSTIEYCSALVVDWIVEKVWSGKVEAIDGDTNDERDE